MNKYFTTLFSISAAAVLFTSCGTDSTEFAEQSSTYTTETTLQTTETSFEDYVWDISDVISDDGFKSTFEITVIEDDWIESGMDLTEAYVGTPYQLAVITDDGNLKPYNTLMRFPVVCNDTIVAGINVRIKEDGYGYGSGEYNMKKISEILNDGQKYALLSVMDTGYLYAFSENNDIICINSGDTDENPVVYSFTYSDVNKYNNVISKDMLTTKIYP